MRQSCSKKSCLFFSILSTSETLFHGVFVIYDRSHVYVYFLRNTHLRLFFCTRSVWSYMNALVWVCMYCYVGKKVLLTKNHDEKEGKEEDEAHILESFQKIKSNIHTQTHLCMHVCKNCDLKKRNSQESWEMSRESERDFSLDRFKLFYRSYAPITHFFVVLVLLGISTHTHMLEVKIIFDLFLLPRGSRFFLMKFPDKLHADWHTLAYIYIDWGRIFVFQ